jgi:hypothetical protein
VLGNDAPAFVRAQAAGEAALARLLRSNEPGRLSLAGAYAYGYGALGLAQVDRDGLDWYHELDPLDALVLGTAVPSQFADPYELANVRDRWLELLRGTVHWKGIETFVRLVIDTSEEFRRPVDDGDLMLVLAGRVEGTRLDQRKLPRGLLPGVVLADSRVAAGPSTATALPPAPNDAAERAGRFWTATESDLNIEHDGTAGDALREGVAMLRRAGMDPASEAFMLLPALYLALVAAEDESLEETPERAEAWARGLHDDSPLIPLVDAIRAGAARGLSSSDIVGRIHALEPFTSPVRAEDRTWHSSPGLALPRIAFQLGVVEVNVRDRTAVRLSEGAVAALRTQRERFERTFGRPARPEDPLFFDPDSDTPTALDPMKVEQATVAHLSALGIAPAWIYAAQHTDGLLPMLDGRFRTANDRREWEAAVATYLTTHPGTTVDTNAELRKLRIGAAAASLNMAVSDPGYAMSLIDRMTAASNDTDDAHLTRSVLLGMAADLLGQLAVPAVLQQSKEFARAWGGTDLAAAVEQATGEATAGPAVLLAVFAAAQVTETDDDEDELGFDLEDEGICEDLVAAVLEHDDPTLAMDVITSVVNAREDAGTSVELLIGWATGYLVAIREDDKIAPEEITEAVDWLGAEYGVDCAGPASLVTALAGHPEGMAAVAKHSGAPNPTLEDLSKLLGIHLFPGMIWLCAGLVATLGNGDPTWLRQYRIQ